MQNQLLLCVALAAVATTSRVQQAKEHLDEQKEASQGTGWSPWELNFEGLSCADLKANPFGGLTEHWPNVVKKAKVAASELASKQNCKICDAKFTGSKTEALLAYSSTSPTQEVTCAATRIGRSACFEGHGKVASVMGLNDGEAGRIKTSEWSCLPCPAGCKSCHIVSGYTGTIYRQVKCVTVPKGDITTTGESCDYKFMQAKGYKCETCKKRDCGMFDFGCSNDDFQANCKFPETFDHSESPAFDFSHSPSDYSFTMKAGADKSQFPPALPVLTTP